MLVLARRPNEQIVINGEVFITILGVGRGGQVRLGISAPPHVQIYRHELWVQIEQENRSAADAGSAPAEALEDLLAKRPTLDPNQES
jgi:carbon storage regulator